MDKAQYMTQLQNGIAQRKEQVMRQLASRNQAIPIGDGNGYYRLAMLNHGLELDAYKADTSDYLSYPLLETDAVITDDGAKPVMLRRPAKGQCCVIDWLNITMKAVSFDNINTAGLDGEAWQSQIIKNVSNLLKDILGFGVECRNKVGINFYDASYRLEHNAGVVCIGGQNDTVMITINGIGCTYAKDQWQADLYAWLNLFGRDAKITRIDLAHDDLYGDYTNLSWFARQDDKGGFISGGRRPEVELRGNWKRPSGRGRSIYIGTRRSSKYCRIYEKGKQLGDPNSKWLRAEVEFKCKHIFIPFDVLIDPSPFFLASYPCFHVFDAKDKQETKTFERIENQELISFARAIELTRHQYGRYINCFRQEFKKQALTDSQLLDLLTDINNKAYPERLDMLTIPEDITKIELEK